jgi:hypothetical protein
MSPRLTLLACTAGMSISINKWRPSRMQKLRIQSRPSKKV